jgi:hypothetical protein
VKTEARRVDGGPLFRLPRVPIRLGSLRLLRAGGTGCECRKPDQGRPEDDAAWAVGSKIPASRSVPLRWPDDHLAAGDERPAPRGKGEATLLFLGL